MTQTLGAAPQVAGHRVADTGTGADLGDREGDLAQGEGIGRGVTVERPARLKAEINSQLKPSAR
ncbi:MAG: hypothetical protein IPM80_24115 [Proteobacteria bacterium]|nr:hypothetical protein [Pseudomonadota bacterium]